MIKVWHDDVICKIAKASPYCSTARFHLFVTYVRRSVVERLSRKPYCLSEIILLILTLRDFRQCVD